MSGRQKSRYVGRERAVFHFLDFCTGFRALFLAVLVGYWAVASLGSVVPRRQNPCQRASRLDETTLSEMPFRILKQGYYNTVFDANAPKFRNAVHSWGDDSQARGYVTKVAGFLFEL